MTTAIIGIGNLGATWPANSPPGASRSSFPHSQAKAKKAGGRAWTCGKRATEQS